MARRRRKRGFIARLLIAITVAAGRHGKRHVKRAAAAAGRATGPKVIRRASDEYGGKRQAGTPIAGGGCPLNTVEFTDATLDWTFQARVGGRTVDFSLKQDTSITELDGTDMVTYALLACCHQLHTQRPIDEAWSVTQIVATNDAAREHFGTEGYHLVPGLDRR